jgi:alpha-galactosidase
MRDPDHAAAWGFALTPVSWRVENREKLRALSRDYRAGKAVLRPAPSGEEGIKIIKALLGLGTIVTNVNLPNGGQMPGHLPLQMPGNLPSQMPGNLPLQMPDMPRAAVVETNAVFTRDTIQPLPGPPLPVDIGDLTGHQVRIQEGIVEAALEHDREKAFRIFAQDWSIAALPLSDARALFDEMTAATLATVDGWWHG